MNRLAFAICRVRFALIGRSQSGSCWRVFVAQAAIAAMLVCGGVQTASGQNEIFFRKPSEPTAFEPLPNPYLPPIVEPVPIAYRPAAKNSGANSQNDEAVEVGDNGGGNQATADESSWSGKFEIASVNDPISPTPFSKLKLTEELPISAEKEAAVKQFGNMQVVFSPATYFVVTSTPESPRTFAWKSPDFYHRPLYFEEPNLERYGHYVPLVQPALSAAHFFGRIPSLPYLVGTYPPCEPTYTYGHYRPGSCNPHQCSRPPLSFQGLLLKGVVTTGIIFALP